MRTEFVYGVNFSGSGSGSGSVSCSGSGSGSVWGCFFCVDWIPFQGCCRFPRMVACFCLNILVLGLIISLAKK